MTTADIAAASRPGSPPTKAALTSWWERFKKRDSGKVAEKEPHGIFGVSLHKSIKYANVAIYMTNPMDGKSDIYGYIPIVVAKCGVYLKENATSVQGIFRLNGSTKRIKDLQNIFDSPDKYGKGLEWTGYTVHDAANIFRRYLNQLPEPIIPLESYSSFRVPLAEEYAEEDAIRSYQKLILELPVLNQQLLLYVLDLLAVFASKSNENLMDAQNLAAIFQPGLISHPSHEMEPQEYLLSQKVLVFLITHQDRFLMQMPKLEQPSTPLKHSKTVTGMARTPSNASAGAEDIRKYGAPRRNVSVSSRKSGNSSVAAGGVSRSNTLPSKRSPRNLSASQFRPADGSSSPRSTGTITTVAGGQPTPRPTPTTENEKHIPTSPMQKVSNSPVRKVSGSMTSPNRSDPHRSLAHMFSLSPTDQEKPRNKLRKKRLPGSSNHSAESSSTSLPANTMSDVPVQSLETVPGSPPSSSHMKSNSVSINAATGSTLMPTMSPTPSATSSVNSQSSAHSDVDHKKTRSRWRWSNSRADRSEPPGSPTFPGPASSNGSLVERMRQGSRSPPATGRPSETVYSGSEDESKRPFGWLSRRSQRKPSRAGEDGPGHLHSLSHSGLQSAASTVHVQPPTPSPSQTTPRAEAPGMADAAASSDTTTPRQSTAIPDPFQSQSIAAGPEPVALPKQLTGTSDRAETSEDTLRSPQAGAPDAVEAAAILPSPVGGSNAIPITETKQTAAGESAQ